MDMSTDLLITNCLYFWAQNLIESCDPKGLSDQNQVQPWDLPNYTVKKRADSNTLIPVDKRNDEAAESNWTVTEIG